MIPTVFRFRDATYPACSSALRLTVGLVWWLGQDPFPLGFERNGRIPNASPPLKGYLLWMDEILHHFRSPGCKYQQTMVSQSVLGGAGFRPSTVGLKWSSPSELAAARKQLSDYAAWREGAAWKGRKLHRHVGFDPGRSVQPTGQNEATKGPRMFALVSGFIRAPFWVPIFDLRPYGPLAQNPEMAADICLLNS